MNHYSLFCDTCNACSKLITTSYSTSFSLGIRMFNSRLRMPIYGIYGFVRFADEIVDTFHDFPKAELLKRFKEDTYKAIDEGISLNPVLQSFQAVVRHYKIERELIDAFLLSMEMDLEETKYDPESYQAYIYGSAEAVGLMCLRVFCEGNEQQYQALKDEARSLGAAFQKINFLRDLKSDYAERGRIYFPGVDFTRFDNDTKKIIEKDIKHDFDQGLEGIKRLPRGARLGVYVAYKYYLQLFKKIRNHPANVVAEKRIRVSDKRKAYLLFSSTVRHSMNFL